jgi:hypothetical protein
VTFAASRIATMFASVSGAGAGGGAGVAAFAALSAAAAESALWSPFEQAAISEHAASTVNTRLERVGIAFLRTG